MIVAEINHILSDLNASASLGAEEYWMSDYHTGKNVSNLLYCINLAFQHMRRQQSHTQKKTWDIKGDLFSNAVSGKYILIVILF